MPLTVFRAGRLSLRVLVFLLSLGILFSTGQLLAEQKAGPKEDIPPFGFQPLRLYKLSERTDNLLTADLNGDGLMDVAAVDNSASRIDILLQRSKGDKPDGDPAPDETGVNRISSDTEFRHQKLPVNEEITALVAGDFNHDGQTDLAYFGSPDKLVLLTRNAKTGWQRHSAERIPDVPPSRLVLDAGDLNGDGWDDLVVLGRSETTLYIQQPNGWFGTPRKLLNTAAEIGLCRIEDINGDGRGDLVCLSSDGQEQLLCVRFQHATGNLGPELQFNLGRQRALSFANIDQQAGCEVLSIDAQTGRLKAWQFRQKSGDEEAGLGRLLQYGFGSSRGDRDCGYALGDLDGDGRNDVLVTAPDANRVILFRQNADAGGLDGGTAVPGLVGADQVRIADLDGKPPAEAVVLSSKEGAIGVCRFDGQRLTFPTALPTSGTPLAMELVDLDNDGRPEVLYLRNVGKGSGGAYAFSALKMGPDGLWQEMYSTEQTAKRFDFPSTPAGLMKVQATGDGPFELFLLQGIGRQPVLLGLDKAAFPEVIATQGSLGVGQLQAGGIFVRLGPDPLLLIAQQNFARRMTLDADRRWQTLEQFNTDESSARIVGAAAIDFDGQPGDEIVLVDTGVRKLRLLRKSAGLYRPWEEVDFQAFPYQAVEVAELTGDGKPDLLVMGHGRLAVLPSSGHHVEIVDIADFETELKDVFFADCIAGDLNGDGLSEVVLIDTWSQRAEAVTFTREKQFRHAFQFRIFEQKGFSDRGNHGSEPRDGLISDVTGDARGDLLLLAHDRLLVYPQATAP